MPSSLTQALRLLALAALLGAGATHADDYANVNQLLRAGKPAEALASAEKYLAADAAKARDPQMRFLKGVAQTDAGQKDEAIATFSKLIEEYPELPEPYNNLAVIYAGQNQLDKARTALEMAVRNNPRYGVAYENLGDIYARLAGEAYGKALQIDANNASVKPKLTLLRELLQPPAKRPHAKP
jgi:tetratricopeptide (TPR) repeat protein